MTELRHIEDIAVEDDAPREECGVFAVYGESDSFGAADDSHRSYPNRSKESRDSSVNGRTISVHGMGLVGSIY